VTARFAVLYMPDGGIDEDFSHVVNTVDSLIVIKARYRTTDERSIVGESLAGLFIVETFLEEPAMFTHYIALDPSVWWNGGDLVSSAPERLTKYPTGARSLYLASSNVPEIAGPTARVAGLSRGSAPKGLTWEYAPRADLTHATIFRGEGPTALAIELK
jgi:hypothetical protein